MLQRIAELAIPPAWEDVWICPYPNGHLQATGTDAAGRKQYRYHDAWRDAARRREVRRHGPLRARAAAAARRVEPTSATAPRSTAAACSPAAVRLLEIGFFRIGSEEYAAENDSYGLATLRKEHVRIEDGVMVFDYPAKSGQRRRQGIKDEQPAPDRGGAQAAARRRRGAARLQGAAAAGTTCARRTSTPTSRRRPAATSPPRTSAPGTRPRWPRWRSPCPARRRAPRRRRKRAVKRAIEEVAGYLGNTPAVCRASYIDPRVFDAFDAGLTDPPGARARRGGRRARRAADPPARARGARCSTSSTSRSGRAGSSGSLPDQQPAQRRPGGHAVDDDRDAAPRRCTSTRRAPARRAASAPDVTISASVVERADAAHAEPGDERLLVRRGPCASRRGRRGRRRPDDHEQQHRQQPALPAGGGRVPPRVSIEPSSRITASSSSFSIRSAPSWTVMLISWSCS